METQRCWRCQDHKISTEESCGHGAVLAQEVRICCRCQSWRGKSTQVLLGWSWFPQMPNMEVEHMVFALLGFGLAQVHLSWICPIPPFWNRKIYSVIHYMLQICNSCFMRLPWLRRLTLDYGTLMRILRIMGICKNELSIFCIIG